MAASNIGAAKEPKAVSEVAPDIHKMYTAQIVARNKGNVLIDITAPLPENYQFQLNTNFDNPFNQPVTAAAQIAGNTVGQIVNSGATGATALNGISARSKWLSTAVWTGGNLFQVSVPFVIHAYADTKKDVLEKMRDMLKLVAPGEDIAGFLRAPGPVAGGQLGFNNEGDVITIRIGEFFTLTPCVVDSINIDFDTQMDDTNHCPMSATITVNALSFWTTTKEDVDKMFATKLEKTS
jgi:hypothetical protein